MDHEPAINLANWQYVAGTGTDARDRVFHTVRQGLRYDAEAALISRWIPSLRSLPLEARHRPWTAQPPAYLSPIIAPASQE